MPAANPFLAATSIVQFAMPTMYEYVGPILVWGGVLVAFNKTYNCSTRPRSRVVSLLSSPLLSFARFGSLVNSPYRDIHNSYHICCLH